jgi:hypothetical protein
VRTAAVTAAAAAFSRPASVSGTPRVACNATDPYPDAITPANVSASFAIRSSSGSPPGLSTPWSAASWAVIRAAARATWIIRSVSSSASAPTAAAVGRPATRASTSGSASTGQAARVAAVAPTQGRASSVGTVVTPAPSSS